MSSEPLVLATVAYKIAHVVMIRPGAMNAMSHTQLSVLVFCKYSLLSWL
jgi:enoyl-CoA hydratase/carnithine racemase